MFAYKALVKLLFKTITKLIIIKDLIQFNNLFIFIVIVLAQLGKAQNIAFNTSLSAAFIYKNTYCLVIIELYCKKCLLAYFFNF